MASKARSVSRETLFADAEVSEDHVQQLLHIDAPGHPGKRIASAPKVLRPQFQSRFLVSLGHLDRRQSVRHGRPVAHAGGQDRFGRRHIRDLVRQ